MKLCGVHIRAGEIKVERLRKGGRTKSWPAGAVQGKCQAVLGYLGEVEWQYGNSEVRRMSTAEERCRTCGGSVAPLSQRGERYSKAVGRGTSMVRSVSAWKRFAVETGGRRIGVCWGECSEKSVTGIRGPESLTKSRGRRRFRLAWARLQWSGRRGRCVGRAISREHERRPAFG